MPRIGIAQPDDVTIDRALSRVKAKAGRTGLLAGTAFRRVVERPAPRAGAIGVLAVAKLVGHVKKRAILVDPAPVHAVGEHVSVPPISLAPTRVHGEAGGLLED